MSKMKVYEYSKCGTCRKAKSFLNQHEIAYEEIPIVEQPPTREELERMLVYLKARGLKINRLFNTSGKMYREMGLSKKLKEMTEAEALDLLSQHGMLVKRPFVLLEDDGWVGFKEEDWSERLLK